MTDKSLHFRMIFLTDIFLDYYIRRINNNLEIDEKQTAWQTKSLLDIDNSYPRFDQIADIHFALSRA